MNFRLIFNIAKALLLARWRQTMVAAVGVTFSITMFITLLSFMTGLNQLLDGLILNRTPHIRLYNDIKPGKNQAVNIFFRGKDQYNFLRSIKSANSRQEIYNSRPIIQQINQDARVLGQAPRILTQVFFNDGNVDISGIVNGIDVKAESKLFHFNDYIIRGSGNNLDVVANSIILGKGLAEKLLAEPGDIVQLTNAKAETFQLKVAGIFQSGLSDFDKQQSYASLATVQKILGKPGNYITDIEVKLKDIKMAPAISREYAQLFGCDAEDIQTANSQFETGSFIRSLISYAVGITLLTVAGFGIFNILNMMIYEKMDSIAILKATGFSGLDVKRIFLLIAITIGFIGGIIGLLAGFLLSSFIDHIPFNTAALPTVTTYPVNYDPRFYLVGFIFSFITTLLAGYLPARKASKVDPVIIIRGK